jgi:CcmD family protein
MRPMNDLMYLYIAYTVIWAGAFVYAAYLHTKQAGLRTELENLQARLKSHEPGK